MSIQTSSWRRVLLGGLTALSVMAGSSLALAPRAAQAVGGNVRVLYTYQYYDYGEDQHARWACLNAASAYNADHTEVQVQEHTHVNHHGGVQTVYILTCIGYFGTDHAAAASTIRQPAR